MAAIAAVHAEAPSWDATDWQEIAGLYDHLITVWPSPVVALNRAITVGHAHGPQAGLDQLDQLTSEPQLVGYNCLAPARAEFLTRLYRLDDARLAYQEALHLTNNSIERDFRTAQLHQLDH